MCSESVANTKLALAARDVEGKELLKAASVNGLPGTGRTEPFACKLNPVILCTPLSPRYTNATVGELVVWAKLALTQIDSNVRRIRIVCMWTLSPGNGGRVSGQIG